MEPETWVGLTTSGGNPICILFVTGISESTLGESKALFGNSFLRTIMWCMMWRRIRSVSLGPRI